MGALPPLHSQEKKRRSLTKRLHAALPRNHSPRAPPHCTTGEERKKHAPNQFTYLSTSIAKAAHLLLCPRGHKPPLDLAAFALLPSSKEVVSSLGPAVVASNPVIAEISPSLLLAAVVVPFPVRPLLRTDLAPPSSSSPWLGGGAVVGSLQNGVVSGPREHEQQEAGAKVGVSGSKTNGRVV